MEVKFLEADGPTLIVPDIFKDERGYFFESFNDKKFRDSVADVTFVQDNESHSFYGVLRGLHFQKPPYAQAKLVRVIKGSVVDVVVDIRADSPHYGKYYTAILSEFNHRQFFIPRGFAHSFVALSDDVIFQYKCDNFYNKESEGSICYNDPDINIPWGAFLNIKDIVVSEKDKKAKLFSEIEDDLKNYKWK